MALWSWETGTVGWSLWGQSASCPLFIFQREGPDHPRVGQVPTSWLEEGRASKLATAPDCI